MTQMTMSYSAETAELRTPTAEPFCIMPAQRSDCETVVTLFGALHSYNASLDVHFALADDWKTLFRGEFCQTFARPDHLWLIVKDGNQAVGLLIGAVHTDSPMFRYRQWIEVEALYVDPGFRCRGIANCLLNRAYSWAETLGLSRLQLYVTASNERAQSVYTEQGFTVTQAIMRKSL